MYRCREDGRVPPLTGYLERVPCAGGGAPRLAGTVNVTSTKFIESLSGPSQNLMDARRLSVLESIEKRAIAQSKFGKYAAHQ